MSHQQVLADIIDEVTGKKRRGRVKITVDGLAQKLIEKGVYVMNPSEKTTLVELPCAVGDTIYVRRPGNGKAIIPAKVISFVWNDDGITVCYIFCGHTHLHKMSIRYFETHLFTENPEADDEQVESL